MESEPSQTIERLYDYTEAMLALYAMLTDPTTADKIREVSSAIERLREGDTPG